MVLENLRLFFSSINNNLVSKIFLTVEAMMDCCSANTSKIALSMSRLRNVSFKTSDVAIYRLLKSETFKVSELLFRCYINMIFGFLRQYGAIKYGDKVYIKIDFTSDRQDFLVLFASIIFSNKSLPIYFSMRNYPKKKGQYNHKKMEEAFIKALKHYLSNKYQYVIVADRGFGNDRFFQLCEDAKFEYMIRIVPNLSIKYNEQSGIMEDLIKENGKFQVSVKTWDKNFTIYRNEKDGNTWYLASNMKEIDHNTAVEIYKKRFRIEKVFQDLKSSGFDLENVKIRKYDRFKRLLFLTCFAYSIMIVLGSFVEEKLPDVKKNLPIFIRILIAYSKLPENLLQNIKNQPNNILEN